MVVVVDELVPLLLVEPLDPELELVLVVLELDELWPGELAGFVEATCVTVGCLLAAGLDTALVLTEGVDAFVFDTAGDAVVAVDAVDGFVV